MDLVQLLGPDASRQFGQVLLQRVLPVPEHLQPEGFVHSHHVICSITVRVTHLLGWVDLDFVCSTQVAQRRITVPIQEIRCKLIIFLNALKLGIYHQILTCEN